MTASGPASGPGSKHPVKIFANIFISFIGAGVLGLPFAFKESGILEGILIMSFVGVISVKAMLLIVDCKYRILENTPVKDYKSKKRKNASHQSLMEIESESDDGLLPRSAANEQQIDMLRGEENLIVGIKEPIESQSELNYGDVGYHALGHTGRILVDFAIVVSQIGFCCAYLIFISQNLSNYIQSVSVNQWLLMILPPLAFLNMFRHLNSLAISSLMAQCANLTAFAVVFWFDFEHIHNVKIHPKEFSLKGFPFFFAIAIYCYEGAGMILSLESSLHEEVRHLFKRYFTTIMVIVTTLYISFGTCGYLSFGPETNAIITLNLPVGKSVDFSLLVKSFLCLALFFTYPIMMFPVMKILERYLLYDPDGQRWKGNVLRISIVILSGIIVLIIPSFDNLMAIVGSGCCTLLAFILPGVFHLKIFRGSLTKRQKLLDWFLIFLGITASIIGLWDAVARLNGRTIEDKDSLVNVVTKNTSVVEHVTRAAVSLTNQTTKRLSHA